MAQGSCLLRLSGAGQRGFCSLVPSRDLAQVLGHWGETVPGCVPHSPFLPRRPNVVQRPRATRFPLACPPSPGPGLASPRQGPAMRGRPGSPAPATLQAFSLFNHLCKVSTKTSRGDMSH